MREINLISVFHKGTFEKLINDLIFEKSTLMGAFMML